MSIQDQRRRLNRAFEKAKYSTTDGQRDSKRSELLVEMTAVFKELQNIVIFSNLPNKNKNRHVERIEKYQLSLVRQIIVEERESNLHRDLEEYLDLLEDNLEIVEGAVEFVELGEARKDISQQAVNILNTVEASAIDEIMKKAIFIKIDGIRRMCDLYAVYSEAEVRDQIKMLMADLFEQWEDIKMQDEALGKKVKEWGSSVLRRTRGLLGLTADATEISGLLNPPS